MDDFSLMKHHLSKFTKHPPTNRACYMVRKSVYREGNCSYYNSVIGYTIIDSDHQQVYIKLSSIYVASYILLNIPIIIL